MSESFGRSESALFLQNPELAAAARRQRLAEELFGQAVKPRNVGGHAGGLAQMGQALVAGLMGYREDERLKAFGEAERQREETMLSRMFSGASVPSMAQARMTPEGGAATSAPAPTIGAPVATETLAPPELQPLIQNAAARFGIPAPLLTAVLLQESNFDPNAVGSAGEIGLGQIRPATARQPGFGVPATAPETLRDPETNINFAAQYLAGRGRSAGVTDWNDPQQLATALRAYNGGGDPNYVANVMRFMPGQVSAQPPVTPVLGPPAGAPEGVAMPATQQGALGLNMEAVMAGLASSNPRIRAAAQGALQMANLQRREQPSYQLTEIGGRRVAVDPRNPRSRIDLGPVAASEREPNFTAGNSLAIATRLAPGYADGTLKPDEERQFEAAYSVVTSERMQIDPQTGQAIFVRPNVPAFLDEAFNRRRAGPPAPSTIPASTAQPQTAPQAPLVQGPRASLVPAMEPPDATAMDGQGRVRVEQFMPGRPQQTPWDWRLTPGGTARPLPGGPAARAAEKEDRATAAREEQTQRYGNVVMQEVDRIFNTMDRATLPTTGFGGWLLRNLPGTAANDINKLLDTIRAESSFSRLQQMREASPTGGALGQVAVQELELLKATIGSLEQSQTAQQFRDNLNRVHNIYLDIIHGRGNGPERRRLSFEEQPQGPQRGPVRVRTPEEARRLPSGTSILLPDGSRGIVP